MGIIRKQTIAGTFFSYLGVILGFITTALLFPKYLTTDQVGLLKLMVSFTMIFAQFGSFGFNNVTTRMFSYFRDYEKKHHGFFLVMMGIALVGFVFVLLVYQLMKGYLIQEYSEQSSLFVEYINWIIPLIFFQLFFTIMDTYYKVLYNAIFGTILKEFVQRIFIFLSIGLLIIDVINFHQFVFAYVASLSLPTVVLLVKLIYEKQVSLSWDPSFYRRRLVRTLANLSLYGILMSYTGILVLHIDTIMINHFNGLSDTGVYSITFFFGTLILIPARPLSKIAGVILADAFRKKNMKEVETIYSKSIINQALIAMLVFVGIWANIDNIFRILPPEYLPGKYVILFISLANLFEMFTGVSHLLIFNSRYYRMMTVFLLMFVFLIIVSNLYFIPIYGIVGAALASAISRFIYSLVRVGYIYKKFKFVPFD
ncbi:MAG: hypothetical protein JEZ03_16955, partial [Bacteroidales bacterium]|nr:hypothetical protein [Bacteroidales bacterium]